MRAIRNTLMLTCAFTLAACGGGGSAPQTVGAIAPPTGGPPTPPTGGTPGSGGGVGNGTGGGSTPTPAPANFLDVATAATFDAIGSFHALDKRVTNGNAATLYSGNASTVEAPSGTINYNPRDGVFTLTIADSNANVNKEIRFQDPAHRTSFTPGQFALRQIPSLDNFNYLEVFDGSANPVFFYQRPGSETTYVSLGGYARTQEDSAAGTFNGQRGVFVFGQKTPISQIPGTGSGTFKGGFIASMIVDPTGGSASYLQWINGSSTVAVDFGTRAVTLGVTGTVGQAFAQGGTVDPTQLYIASGSTFTASGTATLNLLAGSFSGIFKQNTTAEQNVGFSNSLGMFTGVDFRNVAAGGSTAGASSIDGTFFGPNAINVGGNFRIIGGVPNQRVDIMGAFTGAKQ